MVHHVTLHGPPSPRGRPAFWNRPAVAIRAAYPICVSSQQWVVTLSCPDTPGIVSAVSTAIATRGGNITESQQFGDPDTGLFFMRVQFEAGVAEPDLREAFAALAEEFAMTWKLDVAGRPMRTIIMVSTTAHCLHDLLFRQRATGLPIDVAAIVSNHETLAPIAEFYGIEFHHIPVTAATKADAEAQLLRLVEAEGAELVVMARYMQILSDDLCRALHGRVINIHHSFLPSFKGARPYNQAHSRGVKLIGATAHYATADLDEGPIIEQDVERVTHADDARELMQLGQDVERRVLARAVRWHAENRVLLDSHRTVIFR